MTYYKVLDANGKSCHGGDAQYFLPKGKRPGKWMPKIDQIEPCKAGYHVCRIADLFEWFGPTIWECEIRGDHIVCDDKIVAPQVRLMAPTPWDDRVARLFACDCAERVLHIFEAKYPNDTRPRDCIAVARRYASGDAIAEEMAAAWAAWDAWDAAGDAARDAAKAAWAATRAAAWAAAWAAWDAAREAAWAAWDAAGDAARDAAKAAERQWQIERLGYYLKTGGKDETEKKKF